MYWLFGYIWYEIGWQLFWIIIYDGGLLALSTNITCSSGGLTVYVRDYLHHRRRAHHQIEINRDGFEYFLFRIQSKTIYTYVYKHPRIWRKILFSYIKFWQNSSQWIVHWSIWEELEYRRPHSRIQMIFICHQSKLHKISQNLFTNASAQQWYSIYL